MNFKDWEQELRKWCSPEEFCGSVKNLGQAGA